MVLFAPTLAPTNLELISILWHARAPAPLFPLSVNMPLAPVRKLGVYVSFASRAQHGAFSALACLARACAT